MNNPVTTIAGQHVQQRPIRAPTTHPARPTSSPAASRCPGTQSPPRHEPESQQLSHTTSNQTTPLVRSTNIDYGTTIHLHDGLLSASSHRLAPGNGTRMYPMVRLPGPRTRGAAAGRRAT